MGAGASARPALRIPSEPPSVIRLIDPSKTTFSSAALAGWTALLRALARHAGLMIPSAVFGLTWSGRFTTSRIHWLLGHLPNGVAELYARPVMVNRSGSASGNECAEEFAALRSSEVWSEIRRCRIRPVGYIDLG